MNGTFTKLVVQGDTYLKTSPSGTQAYILVRDANGKVMHVSLGDLYIKQGSLKAPSGSLSDGNKGDITVSGDGATWSINDDTITKDMIKTDAVTTAKIADGAVTPAKLSFVASGDVTGPASAVNNNVVFFDGVTGKLIKDSGLGLSGSNTGDETTATIKTKLGAASSGVDGYLTGTDWDTFNGKQASLGYTAENVANKETSALDTSTTKYPCNNVVKTAVDEKQPLDATLTALAGLSTAADKIITVTGTDTFSTDDWKSQAKATYSGTITWTGTTAPSGSTNHQYRWMRVGNLVTLSILLHYATNGSALTQVAMDIPSGAPAVNEWTVLSAASELQYAGTGYVAGSTTTFPTAMARVFIRRNSGDTAYEVVAAIGSGNHSKVWVTVQYFTS